MNRDDLIALLDGPDEARSAARAALATGREFRVEPDRRATGANLAEIYGTREGILAEKGIRTLGMRDAVARFTELGTTRVAFCSIGGADDDWWFLVALSSALDEVLVCLGVDQSP